MAGALIALVPATPCWAISGLTVDDPQLLYDIERSGFSFGELVVGRAAAAADNAALYRQVSYRGVVDSLAADLESLRATDRLLGTTIKARHRLLDARWLMSASARFELIGVVNRMDRAPFAPQTCGEVRFIYRLAYRKDEPSGSVYSRLPMTVNVVFLLPGNAERCRTLAQEWATVDDLRSFGGGSLSRVHLKSVETNLQSVRWPSTVRPDMAGYAEYMLRVFKPQGDGYVLAELENTPDVAKLRGTPALKRRLIAWLSEPANLRAVDEGIARLPDEFLARRATSVALHGTHRLANMPFTQLFTEADLANLPYDSGRTVRSPHGLLRRLNDLSCTGCHQGRTVAGFHFLGVDRPETDAGNAIAVAASPHFVRDQPRRRAYVEAVAAGASPIAARPLSVRADQDEGGFGSHCGLGDPSFAAWTCNPGLTCEPLTGDTTVSRTGICLPATPLSGSACRTARIVHDRDPHRDRLIRVMSLSCSAGSVCEIPDVGFPGGMCARSDCGQLQAGEACGSIAILQGFNACLAARRPFAECLRNNVRPAVLKGCDANEPCRDDYICARTAGGHSASEDARERADGACIPPYFLFQLRVDGHPAP